MKYGKLCHLAGIKHSIVLISFAPFKSTAYLNLLEHLGVDLPEKTKSMILEDVSIVEVTQRSLVNTIKVYGEILEKPEMSDYPVPIGVNIEQLMKFTLASSVGMLEEFSRIIGMVSKTILDGLQPDQKV